MKRRFAGRMTPGIAVGVVAAVVAGGGYAIAAGGGTINACAKKSNGALRIATHCRAGEKPLAWSVQGPGGATGPQGPQGPQGAQGPQGVAGASDGYGVSKPNPTGSAIPLSGSYATVASETVPAGSYYATEDIEFNGAIGTDAFCYLTAKPTTGTATYVGGGDILAADQTDSTSVSGSSSGLITTPSQTVLAISCAKVGSAAASVQRANLTALAVGAVH